MLTNENIARLLDLGGLACQKGMVGDARAIFDGVLAERPDFAPALIGRAFSHVVVDDFAGAEEILNGVLAANAEDADALGMLGLCRLLSGDRAGAEGAFARIPAGVPAAEMGRIALESA